MRLRFALYCIACGLIGGLIQAAARQAAQPPSISGHVYRADTKAPLAGVTVNLRTSEPTHNQVTQTAADGSYAFQDVAVDQYSLVFYRPDFVSKFYGQDAPARTGYPGAPGGSAPSFTVNQRVSRTGQVQLKIPATMDISLSPEPPITTLPDAARHAVYGDKWRDIEFRIGRFSTDGAYLSLSDRDGFFEALGIYDLRGQRLVKPFPEEKPGSRRLAVKQMAWGSDGRLYIRAERLVNIATEVLFAATMTKTEQVDRFPADVAATLRTRYFEDPGAEVAQRTDRYIVSAVNQGHGFIVLSQRSAGRNDQPLNIARGSWELESFILDPTRSQVLYPERSFSGSIVTYDLATHQSRRLFMQVGPDHLLDQTRDAALIAYTTYGPCQVNDAESQAKYVSHMWDPPPSYYSVCFVRTK